MLLSNMNPKDIKVGMMVMRTTDNMCGTITEIFEPKCFLFDDDYYFGRKTIIVEWDNGKRDIQGYKWFCATEVIGDNCFFISRKKSC